MRMGRGNKVMRFPTGRALVDLVATVTRQVLAEMREPEPDPECWNCGELGHKARECPEDIKCYRCEGWGHKAHECATPEPIDPTHDLRERLERKSKKAVRKGARPIERGEGSGPSTSGARFARGETTPSPSDEESDRGQVIVENTRL